MDVVGVAEGGVAWAEGRALTLAENGTSTGTAAMTNREFYTATLSPFPSPTLPAVCDRIQWGFVRRFFREMLTSAKVLPNIAIDCYLFS